jgi:hypothetical protein
LGFAECDGNDRIVVADPIEQPLQHRRLQLWMVGREHQCARCIHLPEAEGECGERSTAGRRFTKMSVTCRGPRPDDDDVIDERRDGVDHELQQGATGEHGPGLVRAEASGSATCQHDRGGRVVSWLHHVTSEPCPYPRRTSRRSAIDGRMSDDDFDTAWIVHFATQLGIPSPDEQQIEALLDLAGRAAHGSGDRRNACPGPSRRSRSSGRCDSRRSPAV